MSPDMLSNILGLFLMAALVLANAFFVAAEFALVSVRKTRVEELVAQGNHAARWVRRALQDPDRFIAATQLGITLASLGLGWVGEPALAHLIEPLVDRFPEAFSETVSRSISAGLAFAVITFLHVVVGELAPKSIALQDPERTSLVVAQPTIWTAWIFKPAIWLLNGAGNGLLRLLGLQPAPAHQMVHSVEELKMIVSASAEGGVVAADEKDMLQAVFAFGEMLVRQVMVPRTEMVAIPVDAPLDEIIHLALSQPFTRFPVFEGDLDQILGMIHLRDVMRACQAERTTATTARGLMREVIFIPDTAKVSTLLRRFRARQHHLAIVHDEYGGTAGMVTLADLLEEIFGEVQDEFATGPGIRTLPDGSSLIEGLTLIDEVNEHFDLDLVDPHYDTIAGFVLGRLGRLARVGDVIETDGARLRVEALDGRRIARLSLFPLPAPESPAPADQP